MAVILSRPQGSVCEVPGFKFLSKKRFRQSLLLNFFSSSLNYFVSCSWPSPYFYQIPSQPTISSSSWPVLSAQIMSGMQVIGCWLKGSPSTFLWLKSPIERVRLRPFTLPCTMGTPVFSMRFLSTGFSGLWSKERGMHFSPCQRAALESPALAQMSLSLVIATTTAVAPAFSSSADAVLPSSSDLYLISSATPGFNFIMSSTWMKVSVSAWPILPSARDFLLQKTSTKWAATNLETSAPPWPSNTPKRAMWSQPGTYSSAMQASYMFFRQPCIQQVAYLQCLFSAQLQVLVVIGLSRQLFPILIYLSNRTQNNKGGKQVIVSPIPQYLTLMMMYVYGYF